MWKKESNATSLKCQVKYTVLDLIPYLESIVISLLLEWNFLCVRNWGGTKFRVFYLFAYILFLFCFFTDVRIKLAPFLIYQPFLPLGLKQWQVKWNAGNKSTKKKLIGHWWINFLRVFFSWLYTCLIFPPIWLAHFFF